MSNIKNIIEAIDRYLIRENKLEATPTELSPYLDKIGLLKDSELRKGKPLRDLLRKKQIPQAYQNGSRWIIPRSNSSNNNNKVSFKIIKPKKPEFDKEHKLVIVANLIQKELENKFDSKAEYILEYKPEWLRTYPNKENLSRYWEKVKLVYQDLTDNKFNLEENLKSLEQKKLNAKQSFDIWFKEPFNLAIEFDEKQHFNLFRKRTLAYYDNLDIGFNLKEYQILNERVVKPGKSGFTKLKSKDPLFPEMMDGDNQDNRIRQRAFRDYLKDISPLANGFNPTIRIPYSVTNGSIKNFSKEELISIKNYIKSYI
jgi:hypothetical protein